MSEKAVLQTIQVAKAAVEFQRFFRAEYGDEPVRCPHIRKLFEELDVLRETLR